MNDAKYIMEYNNIENKHTLISSNETTKVSIKSLDACVKKLSMADFKIVRNLGNGSYAKVVYAKNIHTNKNYALKIINKTFIERQEKVEEVHIERYILSKFDHPNIIKLHSTFQNKNKLYFVLELADKGDLKEFITTHSKYK